MNDYIGAKDPGKPPLIREDHLLTKSSALNALLIVFAIIGAIAVVGAVGMWVAHAGMMSGIGGCRTAMSSLLHG